MATPDLALAVFRLHLLVVGEVVNRRHNRRDLLLAVSQAHLVEYDGYRGFFLWPASRLRLSDSPDEFCPAREGDAPILIQHRLIEDCRDLVTDLAQLRAELRLQ